VPSSQRYPDHILLTGATGFLGKVVLEEIVRLRPDAYVTLIIRPKGKLTARDRLEQLSRSQCFSRLPDSWTGRVGAMAGDLSRPGCGLEPVDRYALGRRVTHIIHCAASIEFDLPVHEAAEANVKSTLNVLELARECQNLRSVVNVSTAYVTPHRGTGHRGGGHSRGSGPIHEELAPLPWPAEELYQRIGNGSEPPEALKNALPAESGHPNTYTLTKCLAEHLADLRYPDLPVTIVRPSIISACLEHPFPGWLDSRAAFAAFVSLIGTGHLRALVARTDTLMDLVPCDIVATHVLRQATAPPPETPGPARIRHATVGLHQATSVATAREGIVGFFRRSPVEQPPHLRYIGPPGPRFKIADYLEHHRKLGSKEFAMPPRRAEFIRRQTQHLNRAFRYFTLNSFDFRTTLEWPTEPLDAAGYIRTVCFGVYRHLLRRSRHELLVGGRRFGRLYRELSRGVPPARRRARTERVMHRIGRRLRGWVDRFTVDELELNRVREALPAGSFLLFRAPAPIPPEETALLCSYAVLARPNLGFGSLWLVPYDALPPELQRLFDEGSPEHGSAAAVAVVAREPSRNAPQGRVLGKAESLCKALESASGVHPVDAAVRIQPEGRASAIGTLDEAGDTARRRSGLALLSRLSRLVPEEEGPVRRIHLAFSSPAAEEDTPQEPARDAERAATSGPHREPHTQTKTNNKTHPAANPAKAQPS